MEKQMTQGATRAQFLTRAGAVGGGALAVSFGLDPALARAATTKGDIAILNYALTLEYLEAAFYTEAEQMGALSGELALFARVVGEHERAHVKALKQVLGRKAVKKPRFNFRGTTEDAAKFAATAQLLEDTGVAAYKGQAPKLKSTALLEAALAIHAVEARHAGWIRDINGAPPAPAAFDEPKTKGQVLAAVAKAKFIVPPRRRRMSRATSPSFAG
jgi:hypothetical protein